MSLAAAAEALHTSESGVSRAVRALEDELGAKLLVRRGKRILGLTEAGREVLAIARRMLLEGDRIVRIAHDLVSGVEGDFVIATTHLHARYALPGPIRTFLGRWPGVRLSLRQGNPREIAAWVAGGAVDLSIAAAPAAAMPEVAFLPCYDLHRIILALERIARFPMITYDPAFPGRKDVAERFAAAGLDPHIVLSATDADLMKVYVKLGFGIAIVGHIAFDQRDDKGLRALDARHLFPPNRIYAGVNVARHLRGYMFDFITLFAPHLTRPVVERALRGEPWTGSLGNCGFRN
jgi:LysR family cys regulon transcriptional activator